ncbi:MAG TPA: hypothetical protein VF708_01470 [Pyrinomonadaceae bacterium]|jgi:hypothetical protein
MASSLVKLTTINNLASGQSTTRNWNNATPAKAVWYIQAVPLESSFPTPIQTEESVEVETTRVWRKLIRTVTSSDVQPFKFEYEIWYTIKNVGAKEVDVDVYASIIS